MTVVTTIASASAAITAAPATAVWRSPVVSGTSRDATATITAVPATPSMPSVSSQPRPGGRAGSGSAVSTR
jgi:hypothetical protein